MAEIAPQVQKLVTCPYCGKSLQISGNPIVCSNCQASYPITAQGQLDLRLKRPKSTSIDFPLGGDVAADALAKIDPIKPNPSPQIDYLSIPIPASLHHANRLTPELLSWFPHATNGGVMLDLGCGGGDLRQLCKHTGLEFVGIDYGGDAPILADAHALPFADQSIDMVVSLAVLEHLRFPFVALREVVRVLKPGGRFIGTVAFLEPFHLNSFYHPSPLGTYDLLATSGFEIIGLEANPNWQGLKALSWMSLFPHSPRWFSDLLVLPLHLLHRLWWKLGHLVSPRPPTSERARQMNNTAGFRFVCAKPGPR